MNEDIKLDEANYFFTQVIDPEQHKGFVYNLRALLGAARCVLVYAHREIKHSRNALAQAWYEKWLQNPVIKFLRDVRNVDVHERPIGTNQTIHLPAAAVLSDGRGQTLHYRPAPTTTQSFAGWNGPEDAPTLCRQYLDVLSQFIEEGQQKGYLTPPVQRQKAGV